MARAIDADYLMERLNKKKAGPANKRYTEGFNDCLMRVRSMVHSMPTLTPPNEWVSVEERLPEEKQRVIVRCERVGTSVGWILWGNWMTDIGPGAGKVTHWMPLPAPPDRRPPEGEV